MDVLQSSWTGLARALEYLLIASFAYVSFWTGLEYSRKTPKLTIFVIKGLVIILLIALWSSYTRGTHQECDDTGPYSVCETIQDFEPTLNDRVSSFVYLFSFLTIPFLLGTYNGLKNRSKNQKPAILLILKEQELGEVYKEVLENIGFTVYYMIDNIRALDVLSSKQINLIVSDVLLPTKDGIQFMKELKESLLYKRIPYVFLSNLEKKELVEECLKLGAAGYYVMENATPDKLPNELWAKYGDTN